MPLFRIDPLHPDLPLCETCASVVCSVRLTPLPIPVSTRPGA
jgi:hypothetical protein